MSTPLADSKATDAPSLQLLVALHTTLEVSTIPKHALSQNMRSLHFYHRSMHLTRTHSAQKLGLANPQTANSSCA